MDDETWDAILDTLTAGEPAAEEVVAETTAPEDDPALTTDDGPSEIVADAPSEPLSAAAAEDTAEPESDPAPAFDWRTDPEAQAALQEAEQFRHLKAQLAEAQRIRAAQEFQRQLTDMADGDPERYQQLTGMLARATTPLQQQAQAAQQQAETTAKAASALFIAMEAVLPEELKAQILAEHEALMAVEGIETMQRLAFGKRDSQRQVQQAIAAKDAEIAELRKQLAARADLAARQATGADAVDGGGGTAADLDIRDRLRNAESFDDYWALLMGRAA